LSLLALEFYLLPWNTTNIIFLISVSVGIAYLIHGSIIKYSTKGIMTGIVFVAIALLIFLPKALLIEDIFWSNTKRFLLPILFIVGGLMILFPPGKNKKGELQMVDLQEAGKSFHRLAMVK